jgi:hypothetical protein
MSIQQPIGISSNQYKVFLGLLLGIDQVHDFKKENRLATENILAILLNIAENVSPLSSAASSQGGTKHSLTVDVSSFSSKQDNQEQFSPLTTKTRARQDMTPQPNKYGNTGKRQKPSFPEFTTLDEDEDRILLIIYFQ